MLLAFARGRGRGRGASGTPCGRRRRVSTSTRRGTSTARAHRATSPGRASTSWWRPVPASCSASPWPCSPAVTRCVTLAAVAVGSALAGLLMAVTGNALGPEDPRPQAAGKPDFTAEVADLRVEGWSPYVAFPAGALTALAASFLLLGGSPPGSSENADRGGTGRVVSTSDRQLSTVPTGPVTTGGARHVQQPAAVRPAGPLRAAARPLRLHRRRPRGPRAGRRRTVDRLLRPHATSSPCSSEARPSPAVAVAGGAAWAAMSFFSTGEQPAAALPAGTLAYAGIDLDPSGGPEDRGPADAQQVPGVQGRARPRHRRRPRARPSSTRSRVARTPAPTSSTPVTSSPGSATAPVSAWSTPSPPWSSWCR